MNETGGAVQVSDTDFIHGFSFAFQQPSAVFSSAVSIPIYFFYAVGARMNALTSNNERAASWKGGSRSALYSVKADCRLHKKRYVDAEKK